MTAHTSSHDLAYAPRPRRSSAAAVGVPPHLPYAPVPATAVVPDSLVFPSGLTFGFELIFAGHIGAGRAAQRTGHHLGDYGGDLRLLPETIDYRWVTFNRHSADCDAVGIDISLEEEEAYESVSARDLPRQGKINCTTDCDHACHCSSLDSAAFCDDDSNPVYMWPATSATADATPITIIDYILDGDETDSLYCDRRRDPTLDADLAQRELFTFTPPRCLSYDPSSTMPCPCPCPHRAAEPRTYGFLPTRLPGQEAATPVTPDEVRK